MIITARIKLSNFNFKIFECDAHICNSLWLSGIWKWNWFGRVLIKGGNCDLAIYDLFNLVLSFKWGCQLFLWSFKVGFVSSLLGLARGEKNWQSFCLNLWTMNAQSGHLIIIGQNDHLLCFQCFWFYFVLILLGNVLDDVIFIFNPFLAF